MTQRRKKRASTPKSNDLDIGAIIIQVVGNGAVLAGKVVELVEGLAHKRNLYKTYPYLREAFSNVKGALGFLQMSFEPNKLKEVKRNERKKRTKRTKSRKKVSKQKTLRHTR